MNPRYLVLSIAIAAALAGSTATAEQVDNSEAARVTQTVDSNVISIIQNSHLRFANKKAPADTLASNAPMNHMQLVLKRSAGRQAALDSLIADQHNPKSPRFRQWLTPKQFGEDYGVAESDIAAVKSWLVSQGFIINNVYPNKMQIDFSGTAGKVGQAFHTQINHYKLKDGSMHLANAGDITVPRALSAVITGVAGLNSFHPVALVKTPKIVKWNADKKEFIKGAAEVNSKGQAINLPNPNNQSGITRGLVPNDMATIYGIRKIRDNGLTGKGTTIAVVESNSMQPADWTNFVSTFNLGQFNGTFTQLQPSGPATCTNPDPAGTSDDAETLLDAEWSTAIAPGANIIVASCSDSDTADFFGGVFPAATNIINGSSLPNVISASYGYGEYFTDSASKTMIDQMWTQADAEGISVFVSTGDSGSNPSFNGRIIQGYYGNTGVDANSFATSPNVTGVGGTDLADVLDGTTSKYFAATPSAAGGSALSYVPEIPWNQSCGNGVAATAAGYNGGAAYCSAIAAGKLAYYPATSSEAGSGGPSSIDRKPAWQRGVLNAANDQSRDLPDVSLFAGSYDQNTYVLTCTSAYPCTPGFPTGQYSLSGGTSLSSPMFAGIQALIDQGLTRNGLTAYQGNAAPTLYALAGNAYGTATGPAPSSLAACNANNGATGTDSCVFHNVTRGSISSECGEVEGYYFTDNCYFYVTEGSLPYIVKYGLTTTDANPTSYSPANKAYPAQPGWSFASGLGSVNATNLLIAWRAFVNAPKLPSTSSAP